ncbi:Phosphoenolpyruvate-protein phosphotransferase [Gammaproteobacteria bacterium]
MKKMKVLSGIPVSSGVAKGTVCLYVNNESDSIARHTLLDDQISLEINRLREGFEKTKSTILEVINASEKLKDNQTIEVFNTYIMILDDCGLIEKISDFIKNKKVNVERALHHIFSDYIALYENNNIRFKNLAHDLIDLESRILASFGEVPGHFKCATGENQAVVVVSQKLTPCMILTIPRENVLAFVTEEGGYTNNATILARSFNIPAIFGIDVKNNFKCADQVIIDGFSGKVFLFPDEKTENYYSRKIEQLRTINQAIIPLTKVDVKMDLKLNINTPQELDIIKKFNHDGIGLLRTEFLFLKERQPPSEEEQFEKYRSIIEGLNGKSATIRLIDIGSDQMPLFFALPEPLHPDLGINAARAVENFYEIYLTQAKALLRAAKFGDLRILYPMISDCADISTFRSLVSEARRLLWHEKKDAGQIKEGIMIETPAAAFLSKELLKEVDFANISSSDLLRHTLTASHGIPPVEKKYHILRQSLVKFLDIIVKAGKLYNKEICLCGEIGSFEEYYPLFIKLGLRNFSVPVARFPYLRCELMHLNISKSDILRKFYSIRTKADIDKFLMKNSDGWTASV